MKKRYLSLILALILLILSFSSCNKTGNGNKPAAVTQPGQPNTEFNEDNTLEGETVSPEETTTEEEDNFEFSEKKAQKLGNVTSDIYGGMEVYYQDSHIALVDDYGSLLFSFDAQGFSPSGSSDSTKKDAIGCEDMNFDGYSDLRLLYRTTSLNTYYLCWMWDMTAKNYVYYEPLATIPTPSFEKNAHTVVSLNKSSKMSATLTTYKWQDGELLPIDHKIVSTEDETSAGSDDVDAVMSITDGLSISYVTLTTGENSNSRWMCKIENENIVNLLTETYNETQLTHKFAFVGASKGTTTVVFRYAIDWNSEYVAEKAVNITVDENNILSVVEIK